jgi:3-hydroxyacyl-CoA dehydrogenase
MAEYQITQWHEIPSLVTARHGETIAKVQLAARFQEAIDEAAMRMAETDAVAYLAGWSKTPWIEAAGTADEVVEAVAADLDAQFDEAALNAILDALNGVSS